MVCPEKWNRNEENQANDMLFDIYWDNICKIILLLH